MAHQRLEAVAPGKKLHVIEVARDTAQAQQIVAWAIAEGRSVMKAAIEVMVVMRPLIDEILARGHKTIVNGMTGGLLWGVGREDQMLRRRKGEKAWTAARRFSLAYDVAGYPPIAYKDGILAVGWLADQKPPLDQCDRQGPARVGPQDDSRSMQPFDNKVTFPLTALIFSMD
jgi:hypothetical protein